MHFFFLSVPNMCNLNITFYISHFKGIETEVIKEKRGKEENGESVGENRDGDCSDFIDFVDRHSFSDSLNRKKS